MLRAGCSDAPGAFFMYNVAWNEIVLPRLLECSFLYEYEIYGKYKEYYRNKVVPL